MPGPRPCPLAGGPQLGAGAFYIVKDFVGQLVSDPPGSKSSRSPMTSEASSSLEIPPGDKLISAAWRRNTTVL
jgi:hypothetical protein